MTFIRGVFRPARLRRGVLLFPQRGRCILARSASKGGPCWRFGLVWRSFFARIILAASLLVLVPAAGGQDRPPEKPDNRVGELRVLEGHTDRVLSVAFSSDGKRAVSGSQDRTVRLWNVGNAKELCRLEGHSSLVRSVCLSADGSLVLSGSYDGTVRLWDVIGGRLLRTFTGHRGDVNAVALSADDRFA